MTFWMTYTLYQDIVATIEIDGADIYTHLGGELEIIKERPPVLSPSLIPVRVIKSATQIEYDSLLAELSTIPRIEYICCDLHFDVEITRVSNPSEIYAIPYEYEKQKIPLKMSRFLELHAQLRPLEKCQFIEKDKTYVIRMKQSDIRACVVSLAYFGFWWQYVRNNSLAFRKQIIMR